MRRFEIRKDGKLVCDGVERDGVLWCWFVVDGVFGREHPRPLAASEFLPPAEIRYLDPPEGEHPSEPPPPGETVYEQAVRYATEARYCYWTKMGAHVDPWESAPTDEQNAWIEVADRVESMVLRDVIPDVGDVPPGPSVAFEFGGEGKLVSERAEELARIRLGRLERRRGESAVHPGIVDVLRVLDERLGRAPGDTERALIGALLCAYDMGREGTPKP